MNGRVSAPCDQSLSQSLDEALSFKSGAGAPALESYIAVCRNPASSMGDFIQALLETAYWRQRALPAPVLSDACLGLARAIDDALAEATEPPYHSRRHFKEVCLGLSLLLSAGTVQMGQASWSLSDEDAWIVLLAAIGHDYGHEGRQNRTFGELEEKSCRLTGAFLRDAGLDDSVIDQVATLIRATEPTLYAALTGPAAHGAKLSAIETMKILLVEADLFASMLPEYGILLGNWLSEEFKAETPGLAQIIASPAGRLKFLSTHPYVSPNSRALNFVSVIESAVAKSA